MFCYYGVIMYLTGSFDNAVQLINSGELGFITIEESFFLVPMTLLYTYRELHPNCMNSIQGFLQT